MRADRGAGFTNGEGGMTIRGDSGRLLEEVVEVLDALLVWETFESCEVFRESGGCELGGGLMDGFSDPESIGLSNDLSAPKLKRVLVLLGAGLMIAGDILLRKSR